MQRFFAEKVALARLRLLRQSWRVFGAPKDYDTLFQKELRDGFSFTRARAFLNLGYPIDLDEPRTFNEKLIHRRLFSRDPIWPVVTDKVAARDWVRQRVAEDDLKLVPTLDIIDDPRTLDLTRYPRPAIVKAAWASGYNVFLKDDTDFAAVQARMVEWWRSPYEVPRLVWASHQIPRRYIVEKALLGPKGQPPFDFKFFVFHGRVAFVSVHFGRRIRYLTAQLLRDGSRAPFRFIRDDPADEPLPVDLGMYARMVAVAEKLGGFFDFIRVDLYAVGGDIYLGELTQTPCGGFDRFTSREADEALGDKWDYPIRTSLVEKRASHG